MPSVCRGDTVLPFLQEADRWFSRFRVGRLLPQRRQLLRLPDLFQACWPWFLSRRRRTLLRDALFGEEGRPYLRALHSPHFWSLHERPWQKVPCRPLHLHSMHETSWFQLYRGPWQALLPRLCESNLSPTRGRLRLVPCTILPPETCRCCLAIDLLLILVSCPGIDPGCERGSVLTNRSAA